MWGLRNLYFFNIQISGVTTADSRRKVMGIAGGGGGSEKIDKILTVLRTDYLFSALG